MSKVDWSKAPEGAEFYVAGCFYKRDGHVYKVSFGAEDGWDDSACQSQSTFMQQEDYEVRPQQWSSEERIDVTDPNGNEGEHYTPPSISEYINLAGNVTNTDNIQKAIQAYNIITGKEVSSSDVQLILLLLEQVKKYSKP